MMLRPCSLVLVSAFGAVIGLSAVPAAADSGHGKNAEASEQKQYKDEKHKKEKKHKEHGNTFRDEDRMVVRDFYVRNPSMLPPGLAKRGGNLPPGLSRGQVITLEIEVHLLPLPRELELKLPPPPHEVLRRIIGRDLVLIDKVNRRVLDVMKDALP